MEIIIKQSIPDAQITWRGREVPASKRKMKLTLSQKGTPRFLLLRATGSISWLFKNRCAEVTFQKHLQHVTHARSCHRPEKTQVCSGPPRAHYFSATGCFKHRAIFFFFFFWWQICYIIHFNRHDHYSWQIGLIPDILPLIMQLCLWLFRANPQDGWSLPKSSQPPSSSPQGKIKLVLLWVWQLSLFQVS